MISIGVIGYIYRHWIVNHEGIEKSYIGQTIHYPTERWDNGRGYLTRSTTKFSKAIKKYGWNNFHHEIIGVVESATKEQLKLDLNEWEIYYIEKYDSFKNGYNSTTGGEKNKTMEDNVKIKISNTSKGKSRNNGKNNPMYGKYGGSHPHSKMVICLNTKEVFNSIKEAESVYGKTGLVMHLKGKSKYYAVHPYTGEKLLWMYYSEYITKQKGVDFNEN